jgi:hypothetical protein
LYYVSELYSAFQAVNSADPGFWVPGVLSLACAVIGFFLCRFRRAFFIVMLPLAFLCMIGTENVVYDVTGELIIHRIGYWFYAGMKIAMILAWVLPFCGAFLPKRHRALS